MTYQQYVKYVSSMKLGTRYGTLYETEATGGEIGQVSTQRQELRHNTAESRGGEMGNRRHRPADRAHSLGRPLDASDGGR